MDEVAENSDELMERYLEGEEISHEELVTTLKKGVTEGASVPGHLRRRDQEPRHQPPARGARRGPALARDARRRSRRLDADGEEVEVEPDEDGDLVAYVFKTRADPYTGRINLLRVYSGVLTLRLAGRRTSTRGAKERIGQLAAARGQGARADVDELGAGDIGAVAKLKETRAGDVLADARAPSSASRRSTCRRR